MVPDHHLALQRLAYARAPESRSNEAIALYEHALARAPMPSTAGALGDPDARAGNPERARDAYDYSVHLGRVAGVRGQPLCRALAILVEALVRIAA